MLKMSCQKLSRQYLHLVLSEGRGLYSLRHMDVSKLFYPSAAEALDAEARAKKKKNDINKLGSISRLPKPSLHYQSYTLGVPSPSSLPNVFALFGEGNNKILYSDAEGHNNVYNSTLRSFTTMPDMIFPKGTICMATHITRTAAHERFDYGVPSDRDFLAEDPHSDHTDSLYMIYMDQDKKGCFEVLAYHHPSGYWKWRHLPLPPFFDDPGYKVCSNIACAVIDGTQICVSSATTTYSFDTVSLEWSKTGDWVLPFHSKADYIPELNLWFGLSASSPTSLCALDLSSSAMDTCDVVPTVQHVYLDVDSPEDWSLKSRSLVNLGLGRFCIPMFFHTADDGPQVTVLTGVDVVVPCDVNQQREQALRRIKHKSKCLVTDRIQYVL